MSAKARILAAVTHLVGRGYLSSIRKYHAVNPEGGVPEAVEELPVAKPRTEKAVNGAFW